MKTLILLSCLILSADMGIAREKRIISSDGVELSVTVRGVGVPLLYLHGGPGSGSYWLEVFSGDDLEQEFQMIYLDQRGVGRSESPKNGDFSINRMVQDFEEVRKALGIDKWLLMGHSFGGILQTGYAQRHPEIIMGMIMINVSLDMTESFKNSWCPKASEFLGVSEPLPCLDQTVPITERWMTLAQKLSEAGLMWKMGYPSPEDMERMNETYRQFDHWNNDFGNSFIDIDDYWISYKRNLQSMTMPVLIYYGERDWMVGPDHHLDIDFPEMLLWVGDTGHMPFIENQDDLMRAVRSFRVRYGF
jgi:proline iminopeptidase